MSERICSIPRCTGKLASRGWCGMHYARWKRNETPHRPTTEQRFFASVEPGDGDCWAWTGTCEKRGYGNFYVQDQTIKAHRWAYEYLRTELPEDLQLDHLCLNKNCVNPWHVEPVPGIENQRRRRGVYGSDLTKCMRGHAMTPDNVYVNPQGVRICRICDRERVSRNRRRRALRRVA